MKSRRWISLVVFIALFQNVLCGQDKLNIKFGKIGPKDFDLTNQKFDSGANAIIIADIGNTSFEGNSKGWFTMIYTRFMRVKILNKNGFDIANTEIGLRHNGVGDAEALSEVKGVTFNLENGAVVESKLDEKSIYTEHVDKQDDNRKFTMPALKEGSIYDLTYTIKSDFYDYLRAWNFQSWYPCLWSEYQVTVPPIFYYVVKVQGDGQFDIKTNKEVFQTFSIRENHGTDPDDVLNGSAKSTQQRWVKKNVSSLKVDSYVTTVRNYMPRVSFQLHYTQQDETMERHDYLSTWFIASQKLLDDEQFGLALNHDNHWMASELKEVTENCKSDEEKIRKIYCLVRDKFSCTDYNAIVTVSSLKDVFEKKAGSVAEINLLLTGMLRHENITADPVILSTRSHGFADQTYPLINQFNYVICVAYAGKKMFKLDASRPYSGFGHLVSDCYNGEARIINAEKPIVITISPDSIVESRLTSVFIVNDEKGNPSGSYKTILGNDGSYRLREELSKTSEKNYFKEIQTDYGNDLSIENTGIDSLGQYDFPVAVHYDFEMKNFLNGNVIYFNPMVAQEDKINPFKSIERHYPVEMPYKLEETYVLNMDIPKGYEVDELPKSARVAYNINEGIFEYLIQKNPDNIQMRVHLKLNQSYFPTDEYPTLRDFFGYVVKKENEQIVFKKIP